MRESLRALVAGTVGLAALGGLGACGLAFPTRLTGEATDASTPDASLDASGADVTADDAGPCNASDPPSSAACVISDAYGVFVSPLGSDTSGAGTQGAPFATLGKAIGVASAKSLRVYVCGKAPGVTSVVYDEHVVLADGVSLYGGLVCPDAGAWSYGGAAAAVEPSTPGPALRGTNLLSETGVTDMAFTAGGAGDAGAMPGASSVAAFVANSSSITLTRVALTAGEGAPGAPGTTPSNYASPSAASGTSGQGGAAAATTCDCSDGTSSTGGAGGNSSSGDGEPGTSSPPVASPVSNGGLAFGNGCSGAPSTQPGAGGANGAEGTAAPPGVGTLTASGWQAGALGSAGGNGKPGQGGGGGGYDGSACASGPSPPNYGGGGGCGGCGGAGGGAGGAGGSSFALLVYASTVVLDGCSLVANAGGAGGAGAPGQGGQAGGGDGASNCCDGTAGGAGGAGGRGAGGPGGLSYAVGYSSNIAPPTAKQTTLKFGAGGAGGAGGNGSDGGATAEGSGAAGTAGMSVALP